MSAVDTKLRVEFGVFRLSRAEDVQAILRERSVPVQISTAEALRIVDAIMDPLTGGHASEHAG